VISAIAQYAMRGVDEVADALAALEKMIASRPVVTVIQQPDGHFTVGAMAATAMTIPENADIALVCDANRFLARQLSLPTGARAFLDGIVHSQIDRLTPWNADNAVFGWTISKETSAGLVVCVVATERTSFEHALADLSRYKSRSLALSVPVAMADGVVSVPIHFHPFATQTPRKPQRIVALLAGIAVITALASQITASFVQSSFDQHLATLKSEADVLRQAVVNAKAGSDTAVDPVVASAHRKRTERPKSEILNELANVLPDTTYLTELEIESELVQIDGVSGDVTALPELIASSRAFFGSAAFAAPTFRQRGGAGDVFRINAKIMQKAGDMP
jgi:general secretion pathway protein L